MDLSMFTPREVAVIEACVEVVHDELGGTIITCDADCGRDELNGRVLHKLATDYTGLIEELTIVDAEARESHA